MAPAQSTAVVSGYEDRRSAEADSGKAGFAAEKAGPLEQSNNLRRSGETHFYFKIPSFLGKGMELKNLK